MTEATRSRPGAAGTAEAAPTARHLSDLKETLASRAEVSIGDVLDHLGPTSFGFVLIVLALLALVPVPGLFGLVFGLALVLVAAQLAAGLPHPWLPARVLAITVPAAPLATGLGKLLPWIARFEALHAPGRLSWLTGHLPGRLVGLAVMVLGVAIMLPIPLANLPPSLAVMMIAFALLVRDGLALMVGLGAGALSLAWASALIWLGTDLVDGLISLV